MIKDKKQEVSRLLHSYDENFSLFFLGRKKCTIQSITEFDLGIVETWFSLTEIWGPAAYA